MISQEKKTDGFDTHWYNFVKNEKEQQRNLCTTSDREILLPRVMEPFDFTDIYTKEA